MILTIGFRGVYRQAQYETVTVEGSVSVDDNIDTVLCRMTQEEVRSFMHHELDSLIAPQIYRACMASRYDSDETVAYAWEGLVNATGSTPQDSTPGRRVRRRQA